MFIIRTFLWYWQKRKNKKQLLEILYDRRTEINSEYTGEKIKIDIMNKKTKKRTDILQVCGYRTKNDGPFY